MKSTTQFLLSITLLSPCHFSISGLKMSQTCFQPLGMEDGRISDKQITATSSYQDTLVGAAKGRLNSEAGGGAWCPRSVISSQEDNMEFLEINLLVDHVITSIVIQGRFANGLGQEFTEYYLLQFWREGMEDFVKYGEGRLLRANTNTYQAVEQVLEGEVVIASKVRIIPFSHHPRTVCLRAELKGCQYEDKGMFDSLLTNNQSLDNSDHNSTSTQKAGEADWGESSFLGAAVGILVTVVLAAISAIMLVLVRNRRQKKCLSELSHYNNMTTGTSSSIQSSLTIKGYKVYVHQPDVIQAERIEQNSDKDILLMDMINRQGKMESGTEYNPTNLSLLSMSKSPISVSPPKFSSNPTIVIPSTSTSWLPHKTALINYNCNNRTSLSSGNN